jgi:A/G-specific adenine glycosylase
MLTGTALSRFRKKMLAWFAEFQRDLPWRRTKDAYCIWLSEIMLQQTRVAAVIPYYQRFLAHFPDLQALAQAPEEEVLRLWAGLGYYSRARNLQKAARQMVAKHDARFPTTLEESLDLSGIGAYTASAILSIAYGKKLAVLDGNVARVIARLGAIRGDLRTGVRWRQLQGYANQLLAPQAPGDWNQAMMEVGATVCTPRSPQCLLCPVADFCKARKLGLTDVIPEKRNKRAAVEITLAALVLTDSAGRALVLPPPKSESKSTADVEDVAALLSGMWHFPTIQVKADPAKELRVFACKSIFGGRDLSVKLEPMPRVRHTVTYRKIMLIPFRVKMAKLPRIRHGKLLPLNDLDSVPVSNLTRKVAQAALAPGKNAQETTKESATVLQF